MSAESIVNARIRMAGACGAWGIGPREWWEFWTM